MITVFLWRDERVKRGGLETLKARGICSQKQRYLFLNSASAVAACAPREYAGSPPTEKSVDPRVPRSRQLLGIGNHVKDQRNAH